MCFLMALFFNREGTLAPYASEGTQFVISYTATSYGKAVVGYLNVDTDEMQWRYEVRGQLPQYQAPEKSKIVSKVAHRLDEDVLYLFFVVVVVPSIHVCGLTVVLVDFTQSHYWKANSSQLFDRESSHCIHQGGRNCWSKRFSQYHSYVLSLNPRIYVHALRSNSGRSTTNISCWQCF